MLSLFLYCIVLSSVQSTAAKQCNCSDMACIQLTAETNVSECCLWDFPPNGVHDVAAEFQEMGYALGLTTWKAPHFCITYPIDDGKVNMKNYFLVKLDLQGPDVW